MSRRDVLRRTAGIVLAGPVLGPAADLLRRERAGEARRSPRLTLTLVLFAVYAARIVADPGTPPRVRPYRSGCCGDRAAAHDDLAGAIAERPRSWPGVALRRGARARRRARAARTRRCGRGGASRIPDERIAVPGSRRRASSVESRGSTTGSACRCSSWRSQFAEADTGTRLATSPPSSSSSRTIGLRADRRRRSPAWSERSPCATPPVAVTGLDLALDADRQRGVRGLLAARRRDRARRQASSVAALAPAASCSGRCDTTPSGEVTYLRRRGRASSSTNQ